MYVNEMHWWKNGSLINLGLECEHSDYQVVVYDDGIIYQWFSMPINEHLKVAQWIKYRTFH